MSRASWLAPLGWLMSLVGCSEPPPPSVPPLPTTSSSTGDASSSDSGDTSTTAATGTDPDSSSSGGEPTGPGRCTARCEAADECSPGPASDWQCNDGFCEPAATAECDLFQCESLDLGVCSTVDGVSQCTFPCTPGGADCTPLQQECTGTDDLGNPICAAPPCGGIPEGEPCPSPGGGTLGTCIDGACTCQVDEECSAAGFACRR